MEIREYTDFCADEIRELYQANGWVAYTKNMTVLQRGFEHSLLVLAAWENSELVGILRAVGDGETIVFIQDILVLPKKQRQGIGTSLMKALLNRFPNVRQIELMTDDTPATVAFYRSLGFTALSSVNCVGFMKI